MRISLLEASASEKMTRDHAREIQDLHWEYWVAVGYRTESDWLHRLLQQHYVRPPCGCLNGGPALGGMLPGGMLPGIDDGSAVRISNDWL